MLRIFAVLVAVSMFAAGCGSGGEGTGMFPSATPDCVRSGAEFAFPGEASCPEGLVFSRQDITTRPGEYFENCGIEGVSRSYAFDDGTGRDEIVRGSLALGDGEVVEFTEKRLNFQWVLNGCSLWVMYDRSLCETSFEYRVTGVSDDSITLQTVNPNDPPKVVSTTCARRQAASSE